MALFSGGRSIRPLLELTLTDKPRLKEPHLLAAFPVSEPQYGKVYKKSPSGAALKEMNKLEQCLQKGNRASWSFYEEDLLFTQVIEKYRNEDVVVIVGHSVDEGNQLVLPSGIVISYEDINAACTGVGIRCVVLTCFSKDLSIHKEISTYDALQMVALANMQLKAQIDGADINQYIKSLRKAHTQLQHRRAITLSAVVASAGTGATGTHYLITSEQNK